MGVGADGRAVRRLRRSPAPPLRSSPFCAETFPEPNVRPKRFAERFAMTDVVSEGEGRGEKQIAPPGHI